jgi:hypothetical protein
LEDEMSGARNTHGGRRNVYRILAGNWKEVEDFVDLNADWWIVSKLILEK